MRFDQLIGYWEMWHEEKDQPDINYGLLATIGYLRRFGVSDGELAKLREIEVQVRDNIETVLQAYYEFMKESTLPETAERFVNSEDDEDVCIDFYQDRDDAELAWHVAREYAEEENTQNWEVIGKVRKLLDRVDDIVLFNSRALAILQETGSTEPIVYADKDFFWWLSSGQSECHIPVHRRAEYLAGYVDGMLSGSLKTAFAKHLLTCEYCREQEEMLRETVAQEREQEIAKPEKARFLILEMLRFRPALASGSTKSISSLRSFKWKDACGEWEAVLSIANAERVESKEKLCIKIIPQPDHKVDWGDMELMVGTLCLQIDKGYCFCTREKLQESMEKSTVDLLLRHKKDLSPDVLLKYQGEGYEKI